MFKSILLKYYPHLVAVLIFLALCFAYFPPVMEGKVLQTHDKTQHMGMSKEVVDFRSLEGEDPLWTNSMFSGMPAYMISTLHSSNLFKRIHKIMKLGLPHPLGLVFLYMIGFYIMLLTFKVDPWLAIVGSIAFALSSYHFVILDAGHNTKAAAIAYMAPVIAGMVLTLRGKYIIGGLTTAFFLALEISTNHLQITYYLGLMVIIFIITHFIEALKEKKVGLYLRSVSVLGVAALLAVGANMSSIFTTIEYGKYTTRGATELTINPDGSSNENIITSGLDKDYVTDWSYGIEETLTFIIPNAKGGATASIRDVDKSLSKNAKREFRSSIEQSNHYWGDQRITSGPVYFGIIVFYLFLLGLFFNKGYLRWAILATFILTVALGWGKNFMPLTEFFLDYFPGYNKFRAVTIILSITGFAVAIMAVLSLKNIIDRRQWFSENLKKFSAVSAVFIVLLALLALTPDTFLDFTSAAETDSFLAQIESEPAQSDVIYEYVDELKNVRIGIFKTDAMIRLFILLACVGVLIAFIRNKINRKVMIPVLGILILFDMWSVDKRYLNSGKRTNGQKRWVKAEKQAIAISPQTCDLTILQKERIGIDDFESKLDERINHYKKTSSSKRAKKISDPVKNTLALSVVNFNSDYRIATLTNAFGESRTSFFHKSIGGYHGAKLKRYQELIEFHIVDDLQKAFTALQTNQSANALVSPPEPIHILNMLNTKYVIYDANNSDVPPLPNPNALGNAWFVDEVTWVKNADEEIIKLREIDPGTEVLVDERYSGKISEVSNGDGSIELVEYRPNYLNYLSSSEKGGVAVFSEMFYDAGWQAYLNGDAVDHVRGNYVLRVMDVPAGENQIEFKFEPNSYRIGSLISLISSLLIVLSLIAYLIKYFKEKSKTLSA